MVDESSCTRQSYLTLRVGIDHTIMRHDNPEFYGSKVSYDHAFYTNTEHCPRCMKDFLESLSTKRGTHEFVSRPRTSEPVDRWRVQWYRGTERNHIIGPDPFGSWDNSTPVIHKPCWIQAQKGLKNATRQSRNRVRDFSVHPTFC